MRTLALLFGLLAACGNKAPPPGHYQGSTGMIALPDKVTKAVLAGPLCEDDHCTCRNLDGPDDAGAGFPTEEGVKRFEIHVGPATNALWVEVDDNVLYKSDEHAEDCFYLDLAVGQHRLLMRAEQDGGLSAAFEIHELGTFTKSWYDTFAFACGAPGTCSNDELDAYREKMAAYTRNIFDPCGTTKVQQITWDAGRAPDQMHPKDLQVEATLNVYKFDAKKPHGDPSCRDNIK